MFWRGSSLFALVRKSNYKPFGLQAGWYIYIYTCHVYIYICIFLSHLTGCFGRWGMGLEVDHIVTYDEGRTNPIEYSWPERRVIGVGPGSTLWNFLFLSSICKFLILFFLEDRVGNQIMIHVHLDVTWSVGTVASVAIDLLLIPGRFKQLIKIKSTRH